MQLVVELYRIAEVAANWLRLCPLRILKKTNGHALDRPMYYY